MKTIGGGSEGRLGLNNLLFYEFTFQKYFFTKFFQGLGFMRRVKVSAKLPNYTPNHLSHRVNIGFSVLLSSLIENVKW